MAQEPLCQAEYPTLLDCSEDDCMQHLGHPARAWHSPWGSKSVALSCCGLALTLGPDS